MVTDTKRKVKSSLNYRKRFVEISAPDEPKLIVLNVYETLYILDSICEQWLYVKQRGSDTAKIC